MALRLSGRLRRRSATALGVYVGTALGFLISVVATRELGAHGYARFATVLAAVGFLQMLLDLTVEEALVKYGFRFSAAEDWPRFRRLFELALAYKVLGGLLGTAAVAILAAASSAIWPGQHLFWPLLLGGFIPLAQSVEGVAAGALILRGRYDLRSYFSALAMGLRVLGIGIGGLWGVTGAVAGMLIAQVVSSAAIAGVGVAAFRRFPARGRGRLDEHARDFRTFVFRSTVGSSLVSARSQLGTPLIGFVSPFVQSGYFRNAQAPLTAMSALSTPARLVLLTDQTSDYEHGRHDRVLGHLRRYALGSAAIMAVVVPVGWFLMPWLIGFFYTDVFRAHSTQAARIILIVGALQLVFAWTDTLPITLGRPGLRIVAHVIELAVFIPALLLLAHAWGATGGAIAMLLSTVAFCAFWSVLFLRMRGEIARGPSNRAPEAA